MKTLSEQIKSVISEMSYLSDVDYSGRISNPRQVAVNYRYSSIRVESMETTPKTWKNRYVTFRTSEQYTDGQIRKAIETLVDSAISWFEAKEIRNAKEREKQEMLTLARESAEREWVSMLRIAKSGQSETPLEGTEHAFRVFSTRQLVDAGKETWAHSISVPLPVDREKRAAFLAKLDSFVATL